MHLYTHTTHTPLEYASSPIHHYPLTLTSCLWLGRCLEECEWDQSHLPTMRGPPFSNQWKLGHDLRVCTFEPHLATLSPTFLIVFLGKKQWIWDCDMKLLHEPVARSISTRLVILQTSLYAPHTNAYRDVALHGIFHGTIKPRCRHEALREIWEVSNHISEIKTWW